MAEPLPLGAAQEGIWTGQQFDPDSPAFNTAEYVEIRGPVDARLLEAAVRGAVGEAEALNVVFEEDADGRPWQRPRDDGSWPLHTIDTSAEADPLAAATAWMRADLDTPVDLRKDPLFRQAFLRLGPDHLLWYQRVHHIALDGYGLSLVARRVAELYTALVEGRDPRPGRSGRWPPWSTRTGPTPTRTGTPPPASTGRPGRRAGRRRWCSPAAPGSWRGRCCAPRRTSTPPASTR